MKILILGASFGGMTTAFELRKRLTSGQAEIRVIAKDPRFTFIPSLPWVAMGSRSLDQIGFDPAGTFERKEIEFVHAGVTRIDPKSRQVFTDAGEYAYDVLVIATGHRSANEAVPGLGPFDGPGHSLMSPPEAEEARDALREFLDTPGPMVVGCAPGASCIGPAYEFVFQIDHLLRRRRMRHRVPIVFVTPEPFLGHFGVGGIGKARQFLEGEFEHRDIRYLTSKAVSKDYPRTAILLVVLVTIVFGFQFPKIHIDTDPENMLPADQPDRVLYNRAKEDFGIHDLIVLGVTDETGMFRLETLGRVARVVDRLCFCDIPLLAYLLGGEIPLGLLQQGAAGALAFSRPLLSRY